jgi:SpoVK/Ycf46/Vps4 family AAA+-type ATPase
MIKEIAQDHRNHGHQLIFISPELKLPNDVSRFSAQFTMSLPDRMAIRKLIVKELKVWKFRNQDQQLRADRKAIHLLVNNLLGLTVSDCERLIRNAIYDDNAISKSDLTKIQRAKYELIGQDGVLSFEFETAKFGQVGGFANLKNWLDLRRSAFLPTEQKIKLDVPKGILLVGIQGCGKSLAARAVAGAWDIPLLRLDFGALYNKFFGETEKNMRQAITLAETMSPCVLWIDEIEKGISTGDYDSGTSQRLLATLLTWMADNTKPVFIVATANNISALPPELIRKGRLDEVFFVDLPNAEARSEIFSIHLSNREVEIDSLALTAAAKHSAGFSGAEIEQVVVSALYQSMALDRQIDGALLLAEIERTSPLSVVMSEQISQLQTWAKNRTVPAN